MNRIDASMTINEAPFSKIYTIIKYPKKAISKDSAPASGMSSAREILTGLEQSFGDQSLVQLSSEVAQFWSEVTAIHRSSKCETPNPTFQDNSREDLLLVLHEICK